MWKREAFVLIFNFFVQLTSYLEMGLSMLFDRGPMLAAETADRYLKQARSLSPIPLKEALTAIRIGIKVVD